MKLTNEKIEDGWHSYKGHYVIGEMNRHPALQSAPDPKDAWIAGAHFAIPIIRAESKATINNLTNKLSRESARSISDEIKIHEQQLQIASQAAEIEKLKKQNHEDVFQCPACGTEFYKDQFRSCLENKIASLQEQVKICEEALKRVSFPYMQHANFGWDLNERIDISTKALSKLHALRDQGNQ
jgi:predicted RNA-binding Zn-ribbon protein involved in translation (DUF1610 family)